MAQLDLSGIPPEKRPMAILDHLSKVTADVIHDRKAASMLTSARLLRYSERSLSDK